MLLIRYNNRSGWKYEESHDHCALFCSFSQAAVDFVPRRWYIGIRKSSWQCAHEGKVYE